MATCPHGMYIDVDAYDAAWRQIISDLVYGPDAEKLGAGQKNCANVDGP